MCLIAYSPDGKTLPADIFEHAQGVNSDGIGIMSSHGVMKFHGRKFVKRARRYLRQIEGTPFGIHFRFATHGKVDLALCHPFNAPNSDAWVMHNGVIGFAGKWCQSDSESDTTAFVARCMKGAPNPTHARYKDGYYERVARMIGRGNKFLVMHEDTGTFTLVNEKEGEWLDGLWYSNEYSLPMERRSWRYADEYDWSGIGATKIPASVDLSDDTAWARWLKSRETKQTAQSSGTILLTPDTGGYRTLADDTRSDELRDHMDRYQSPRQARVDTARRGAMEDAFGTGRVADAIDGTEAHALAEYYRAIEREGPDSGFYDNGADIPGTSRLIVGGGS